MERRHRGLVLAHDSNGSVATADEMRHEESDLLLLPSIAQQHNAANAEQSARVLMNCVCISYLTGCRPTGLRIPCRPLPATATCQREARAPW